MKANAFFVLMVLASIVVFSAQAQMDLDAAFSEMKQYDTGKNQAALEQIRSQMQKSNDDPALRSDLETRMIAVLDSTDATVDAKQFVCKQLGRIGTKVSVPSLEKLLRDEQSAGDAVFALREIPVPEAGDALRKSVEDSPARLDIIQALSVRKEKESIPVLVSLTESADAAVSAAAIGALGFFPNERVAKVLSDLADKPEKRDLAIPALLHCALSLADAGKTSSSLKVYRKLYALDSFPLIRRGALLGVIEYGGDEGKELFLSAIKSEDDGLRRAAIGNGLRLLGDRADFVTGPVMEFLPNLPEAEQASMLAALVDLLGAAMRPHMLKLTESNSLEQRKTGLRGLARIGDATTVPALVKAVGNDDAEKELGLIALRQLKGEGIDEAIGDALEAADAPLKIDLITVIQDRNAVSQVGRCLQWVADRDAGVAETACKALGQLAGKEHLQPLLNNLIQMDNEDTMSAARKALLLTARRTEAEADLASWSCAALSEAQSDKTRVALLQLLGGLPCDRSFAALKEAANGTNEAIQDAALRELFDWPGVEAMPLLDEVAAKSANKTHRVLALRGYVRLLGTPGNASVDEQTARYEQAAKTAQLALTDEVTRHDAGLAIVSMVPVIAGFDPDMARSALEAVVKHGKDKDLAATAQSLIQCIDGFGDYVMNWQVSPEYGGKEYTQLFDQVFDPEKNGAKVAWSLMPVCKNPAQPWLIDIAALYGAKNNMVTYLRTSINRPTAAKAILEIGSDDGVKVWVNGEVVHANNTGRALEPGQDKAETTLKAGTNDILVKVTQSSGPWGFCLRIR